MLEDRHTGGVEDHFGAAAAASTASDPFAMFSTNGNGESDPPDVNMAQDPPITASSAPHDPFFEAIFTMPDPFGMGISSDSNMPSHGRYMMSGGIGGLGSFPTNAFSGPPNHPTMPSTSSAPAMPRHQSSTSSGDALPRQDSQSSSSRSPDEASGEQNSGSLADASKRKLVSNAPLKRGNACLFCRKRKLKCDAERPRCQQCGRLNGQGECVYDDMLESTNGNGRSTANGRSSVSGTTDGPGGATAAGPTRNGESSSARFKQAPYVKDKKERDRIRALEAHVQELEARLKANLSQQNGGSSTAPINPDSMLSPGTEDLLQRIMEQGNGDAGFASLADRPGAPMSDINSFANQLPMPFVDPVIPQGFDWSSLDPSMAGFATGFETTMSTTFKVDSAPTLAPAAAPLPSSNSPFSAVRSPDSASSLSGAKHTPIDKIEKVDFFGSESASGEMNDQLVGGWFDPTDPPPFVRDKLLNLYFSFLSRFPVDIHIPRFYARLSRPKKDRPHPAWLFSMYLLGSRMATDDPNIRSLHTHFLQVAREQIQIGIDKLDRLLDVLRACNNLVMYYYSSARYHEAWIQSGQAVQIAILLGLHVIPSNDINKCREYEAKRGYDPLRRSVVYYGMLPPDDGIELAERISAWWQTYTVNLAGATATSWPSSVPKQIKTPFPRPMIEYELGFIAPEHDVTLDDLLQGRITRASMSPSTIVLRIQMLCLMQKASEALRRDPEPGAEISEVASDANPQPGTSEYAALLAQLSQKCIRYRRPAEFAQIEQALNAFIAELPPAFHDPVDRSPGASSDGSHVDLGTLCFQAFLATVQLFLYDIDDYRCPCPEALTAARRVSTLTQLVTPERYRAVEPFMAMIWTFAARALIKEVKRLRFEQDPIGAAATDAEVDNLLRAMSSLGADYGLAEMQVKNVTAWRAYNPGDPKPQYTKFAQSDADRSST